MLLQLHIYQKNSIQRFFVRLKKLILGHFLPQNRSWVKFEPLYWCYFKQKKAKTKPKIKSKTRQKKHNSSIHWFLTKPANSFWAHFEPHKLFPWKHDFVEMYNSYAVVTLCKISQKFQTLISYKTWKTLFWALFGPLLA